MSNPSNEFLMMLVAAQQQQQQKQQQQQQQQSHESPGASSSSTEPKASANSTNQNGLRNGAEMMLMWQNMMQAQLLQQMSAVRQQQELELKRREEQKKKKAMEEMMKKNGAKNVLDAAMWQLVAAQMLQQQKELAQKQQRVDAMKMKKKKEEDAKEQLIKMCMSQLNGSPDAQLRMPLHLGWRRQTFVRSMSAAGIRGDVNYYGPCGRKLSTNAEVAKYLNKMDVKYLSRDNFSFNGKLVIGEFLVNREKEIVKMSEKEINADIERLNRPPDAEEAAARSQSPLEVLDNLNDDFIDEPTTSGIADDHRSREPGDDLLVPEIRPLPDLPRIVNQCLDGQGFADALMIHEFMHTFHAALQIPAEQVPSLEKLCTGLAGSEPNADYVLQLAHQLLRLVLEHPGMTSTTVFGQSSGELGIDRENFSEVMRLFLSGRDEKGQKLARQLDKTVFERIGGSAKAAIMAYFCDELLSCPNVIKEIERNLDEVSRLRGEKWMREGKARTMKAVQQRKMNAPVEDENGSESDASRPSSPKVVKKFTPGLGQCEVLTAEEEAMSVEELESSIVELHVEAQQINRKIHETSLKIRSFPFGLDRFHRQYWMLAHTPAVVIESIESGARDNPGCNIFEVSSKDPPAIVAAEVNEDVIACVEDLVDSVILTRARADKKQRRRYRRVDNCMKRGWWTLDSKESLEHLKSSLHGRGMRERCLHRLLCKPWFLNEIKLGTIELESIEKKVNEEVQRRESLSRIVKAVEKLRKRLIVSDVSTVSERVKKPSITPPSMALAQVVKDDIVWKTYEGETDHEVTEEDVRKSIAGLADIVEPKFWRRTFEMEKWKDYVASGAETTSQLMVALQMMEAMVAWERSAREALCQICKSMDGDEMLVCDGCETGCHMECFRPPITKVPNGDWFCPRCREERDNKWICMFCCKDNGALLTCERCDYHMHAECALDEKPSEPPKLFICPHCVDVKSIKFATPIIQQTNNEADEKDVEEEEEQPVKAERKLKRKLNEPCQLHLPLEMNQELCRAMLDELELQPTVGPFLEPVDLKTVPGYRKIIAKPMDLSTIRAKNEEFGYEMAEDFAADVELMFSNCKTFNVDESPVGQAGIQLKKFFTKRWRQLKYNYSKRLKRLQQRHS